MDIPQTPIKDLMKQFIIICSEGYQNSDLAEFVNYSWDRDEMKNITYESLDPEIEITEEVKLNANDLKEYNKNHLTLVTPRKLSLYSDNYHPSYFWDAGCQFVCVNYQNLDDHIDTYVTKFRTHSFIKKPIVQRANIKKREPRMSVNLSSSEETKNPDTIMEEKCPEKPTENYSR